MKKEISTSIRIILKRGCLLLSCGVIGFLLIILSNLLPVERIRSHIRNGAEILIQNSAQYQYADGYVSAVMDNSTDDLILAKAVYQSTDPVQDAVMVPNYSYPGEDAGGLILFETLNRESTDDAYIDTYPIYWHGYLAVLRPLFLILTYADFRILNQILELILFTAVLYLMQKRGLGKFIPAFVVMIAFWNPGTMGVSLQYAPCYYLSMGGSIIVLLGENAASRPSVLKSGAAQEEKIASSWKRGQCGSSKTTEEAGVLTFFMMQGVLTAYFDFLTYPIATFGVPMIFVILRRNSAGAEQLTSYVARLQYLVRCGLWWVVGYAGMWAEKWIYGSFLSGSNILSIATGKISERASAEEAGEQISRLGTVGYLLHYALLKKPYIILFLLFLMVIAAWLWKNRNCAADGTADAEEKRTKIYLELVCIGVLPLVWYFVAANHSYIHPRLVYRAMGVVILSTGCALTELFFCVLHGKK